MLHCAQNAFGLEFEPEEYPKISRDILDQFLREIFGDIDENKTTTLPSIAGETKRERKLNFRLYGLLLAQLLFAKYYRDLDEPDAPCNRYVHVDE